MFLKNEDTKEQLIAAAVRLLSVCNDASDITSRQIAAEAKTNLAMINYCFKSKEELINIAIGRVIEASAADYAKTYEDQISPKEHLRQMLCGLINLTFAYRKFTRVSIPYILIQEDIIHPFAVLPIIKEHFKEKKSETECRVIAYQMISFMQLIFLRSDEFFKYSGIDINDEKQRNDLIEMQLNLFLGDEN